MDFEQTGQGQQVRLRPHGAGRFVSAAFMSVWLCGWAIGEAIVGWIVGKGIHALATGEPLSRDGSTPAAGVLLIAGAFVAVWLVFWTIGGVMAMREWCRLLMGEDRLLAGPAGLTVEHRYGPFRSRQTFARDVIRHLDAHSRPGRLQIETTTATRELSTLGTYAEHVQAAQALERELNLSASDAAAASRELPPGWQEALTPEGERVLIQDPALRATRARGAAIAAMVTGAAALGLVSVALRQPPLFALVAFLVILTVVLSGIALWMTRGRMEWKFGIGQLVLRRRWGAQVTEVFTARSLELNTHSDSDSGPWWVLEALADPPAAPSGPVRITIRTLSHCRRIEATTAGPTVPRQLGAWLAQRTELPLVDQTTEGARSAALADVLASLAKSGPVGRVVGRLISTQVGIAPPRDEAGSPAEDADRKAS